MGTIVVTTNISLDGVVAGPRRRGGLPARRLVRRVRGQGPPRLGSGRDRGGAGRRGPAAGPSQRRVVRFALVVSRWRMGGQVEQHAQIRCVLDPDEPKWSNSTVIKGDVVSEVSKLKQQISGEILVYASYQLVRTLIEHDLVDELRLVIFPVVLGDGERLFGETSDKKPMRLLNVSTIGDGLAFVTYEVVRDA